MGGGGGEEGGGGGVGGGPDINTGQSITTVQTSAFGTILPPPIPPPERCLQLLVMPLYLIFDLL